MIFPNRRAVLAATAAFGATAAAAEMSSEPTIGTKAQSFLCEQCEGTGSQT